MIKKRRLILNRFFLIFDAKCVYSLERLLTNILIERHSSQLMYINKILNP
jgi:hypothetical protein